MHPKPMRETLRPSEPKATCFIADDYSERRFVHLGVVFNRTSAVASVIFSAVLLAASGFLAFDLFRRSPTPHALMNVEGIVALSFLAILLARSVTSGLVPADHCFDVLPIAAVLIAIPLAFAVTVHAPFLYDDYTHITDASRTTWRTVAHQFGPAVGRGLFFRPTGFFIYWITYLGARANPTRWHAGSIALHAACSGLTYALSRQFGLSRTASLGGALLFGLSGVSAEAVAWIDARFDLLTTALVLLCLIFVCRYAVTSRAAWLVAVLLVAACAMLTKESGFCLPILVAILTLFRSREYWSRITRAAAVVGALAIVLFAYRWWALGGIGGYAGAAGHANIVQVNTVRTLDALLFRQWAVLFFPVNWSTPVRPMLRITLAAIPLVLAACAWIARPPRRPLLGCLAFVVAAGLPVQHLLLFSPDLAGSRILYLGSVGWALLWALVLNTMTRTPRIFAACALLVVQVWILEHNLKPWRDTAELARLACIAFGQTISGSTGPVVVHGLPAIRNGVVFLQNGFPQCVEMNSGVPAWRIQGRPESGASEFVWNKATDKIEAAPGR